MTSRAAKQLFPNPFYILLLISSTLFVFTALGYLISPTIQQQAETSPNGSRSLTIAVWLDRRGPLALGVEFVVMLASGLLAMASDRWLPARKA
jgi:hypothetical protein